MQQHKIKISTRVNKLPLHKSSKLLLLNFLRPASTIPKLKIGYGSKNSEAEQTYADVSDESLCSCSTYSNYVENTNKI